MLAALRNEFNIPHPQLRCNGGQKKTRREFSAQIINNGSPLMGPEHKVVLVLYDYTKIFMFRVNL